MSGPRFLTRWLRRWARWGCSPAVPGGVRRDWRRSPGAVPGPGGTRPVRLLGGDHPGGRGVPGRRAGVSVRDRGAEAHWLPALCSGGKLAAFGLTEPGGGTDVRGGMRPPSGWSAHPAVPRNGCQRVEGVHHQRGDRHHGAGDGRGPDRGAGDLHVPGPGGHARPACQQEVLQGRLGGVGHPGAGVQRGPGAEAACSVRSAAATPSSWPSSTRAGWPLPRWPPGWPRAASMSASGTRRSAPRSGGRSGNTRPSSS